MIFLEALSVNQDSYLEIGGCDTVELAKKYGTPLYVMDEELIREKCRRYTDALKEYYPGEGIVAYAGKAFLTLAMARLIHEEGLYLDVVSGGEIHTALKAGFPPEKLYFHGNNKTGEELEAALGVGVGKIVVDSVNELEDLLARFKKRSAKGRVLLRIKPGIEAHTHDYILTGQEDSKFGFGLADGSALEAVELVLSHKECFELVGFHCHIGSQIFQLEPFQLAAEKMVGFMAEVRDRWGYTAVELDLGGGLGIRHRRGDTPPSIDSFVENSASAVQKAAEERDFPLPRLVLEPGRSIAGEAGITVYEVGVIKDVPGIRRYVSVDGGMMDNIRPALYGAEYEAVLANRADEEPREIVTIAGKACESGDILIRDVLLPPISRGDLLAVFSTGAYCYSMASNYNRNPRPAVVFVSEGKSRLVVRRETEEDLTALDEL